MGPVSGEGYFAGAPVPVRMIPGERTLPNRHACEVLAEAGSCPHLIFTVGDIVGASLRSEDLRAAVAAVADATQERMRETLRMALP